MNNFCNCIFCFLFLYPLCSTEKATDPWFFYIFQLWTGFPGCRSSFRVHSPANAKRIIRWKSHFWHFSFYFLRQFQLEGFFYQISQRLLLLQKQHRFRSAKYLLWNYDSFSLHSVFHEFPYWTVQETRCRFPVSYALSFLLFSDF